MKELSSINIPDLGEVEEAEVIELCVEASQGFIFEESTPISS